MKRKPVVAVYDAKPYDRENLSGCGDVTWNFLDFRLEEQTFPAAKGADAACIFVNDDAGATVLAGLAECGVRHLALRCAGFNHCREQSFHEDATTRRGNQLARPARSGSRLPDRRSG